MKFIKVVVLSAMTFFSFASCSKDAYEKPYGELQYPVEVEISGFVYDKNTEQPVTGRKINVVLEVFKDDADISSIQVESVTASDDDGSFTIEISAMAPYLKLTAMGQPDYENAFIDYYLMPGGGMSYDQFSNGYKVKNQIIYLGKR